MENLKLWILIFLLSTISLISESFLIGRNQKEGAEEAPLSSSEETDLLKQILAATEQKRAEGFITYGRGPKLVRQRRMIKYGRGPKISRKRRNALPHFTPEDEMDFPTMRRVNRRIKLKVSAGPKRKKRSHGIKVKVSAGPKFVCDQAGRRKRHLKVSAGPKFAKRHIKVSAGPKFAKRHIKVSAGPKRSFDFEELEKRNPNFPAANCVYFRGRLYCPRQIIKRSTAFPSRNRDGLADIFGNQYDQDLDSGITCVDMGDGTERCFTSGARRRRRSSQTLLRCLNVNDEIWCFD